MMQLVMTFFSVVLVPIFLRSQWKFSSLKYWFNLHIYSCQIANVVVAYIHANDYIAFFFSAVSWHIILLQWDSPKPSQT